MNEIADFISQCGKENFHPMYRGQANIDWPLTPSIGRLLENMNKEVRYSDWLGFEQSLLTDFQRLSTPYLKYSPNSRIEWLVEAQHYGLATPLLDWSSSPLKALYFAVEKKEEDHIDGVVYIIEPRSVSLSPKSLDSYRHLEFYYPKHTNERLIAQDALFTIFPYPETLVKLDDLRESNCFSHQSLRSMRTIKIDSVNKPNLREQLNILGINHMSMYPGIEGVTKHIMNSYK